MENFFSLTILYDQCDRYFYTLTYFKSNLCACVYLYFLFLLSNKSRRNISNELVEEVEAYMEKLQPKNTGDNLRPFSLLERLQKDKAEASTPAQKIIVSNSQRWVMQLDIMKKHIHNILMKNNMKGWNCMIPNSSYPLSREEMEKVHQKVETLSSLVERLKMTMAGQFYWRVHHRR